MAVKSPDKIASKLESNYDRASELKAFDETKAGVKGLVDSGIHEIPQIFIEPPIFLAENSDSKNMHFSIPIIDLESIDKDSIHHNEIIDKLRSACEAYGFFQVVNHGIPVSVMNEMLNGVRAFYEQDTEVKKQFYTRDVTRKVVYNSNFNLYNAPLANWRDTFFPPKPEELPVACREIQIEYSKQVMSLGFSLFGLLSEALGLNPSHLRDMGCDKGLGIVCHCYPQCPQPELTLGTCKHTDNDFLTVLLQDQIGGLQILHHNQWIDVPPVPGALIVNIGDLLQLIKVQKRGA